MDFNSAETFSFDSYDLIEFLISYQNVVLTLNIQMMFDDFE